MAIDTMDFQALVHQRVSELIEGWKAHGFSQEEVQEAANQVFNMGLIAGQQVVQEGGIQPQGMDQKIPYTEAMAENVVTWFLQGMSLSLLKAKEQKLPSQDQWPILQNVAYHLFEQAKQVVVATLGQESTPEVQISNDQIMSWLSQTASEALLYYIGEHEKQYGPIRRTDQGPDLLAEQQPQPILEEQQVAPPAPEPANPQPQAAPEQVASAAPEPQPVAPQPVAAQAHAPEMHHKYAAVSLYVSTLPQSRQQKVLASFSPEEQQIISQYRDPDQMVGKLDLNKVAQYLRKFKAKAGQSVSKKQGAHDVDIAQTISKLPAKRLDRLFEKERPLVRGYIKQFLRPEDRSMNPYQLPAGVAESLAGYIRRNFPEEVGVK